MARVIKCTSILPYDSGLPRDVTEITHWFRGDDSDSFYGEELHRLAIIMGQFWNQAFTGLTTSPLSGIMSPVIDRTSANLRLRAVAVDVDTGEELGSAVLIPIPDEDGAVGSTSVFHGATSGSSLPNEVALCQSFMSTAEDGPVRRRRGRIYLGPFGEAFNDEDDVNHNGAPVQLLIDMMATAGSRMIETSNDGTIAGVSIPWVVYGRRKLTTPTHSASVHDVDSGWVDNEWDTQRRRGQKATSRTTFTFGT